MRSEEPKAVEKVQVTIDHVAALIESALQAEEVEYEKVELSKSHGVAFRKFKVKAGDNVLHILVKERYSSG